MWKEYLTIQINKNWIRRSQKLINIITPSIFQKAGIVNSISSKGNKCPVLEYYKNDAVKFTIV